MKPCTTCGLVKTFREFHKSASSKDGHRITCVECVNASRRASWARNSEQLCVKQRRYYRAHRDLYARSRTVWMGANREKMLAYYRARGSAHRQLLDELKASPCLDCGDSFPAFIMEFDHVRGGKRFALGKMANHDAEAVASELEKCELLCCACHRVRTQARKGSSANPRVQAFREWLRPFKARPCLDCDLMRPEVAMDFDHIEGKKVTQIADMWSWGRDKVLAEIAKCELVCANCHRIRTHLRRLSKKSADTQMQLETT